MEQIYKNKKYGKIAKFGFILSILILLYNILFFCPSGGNDVIYIISSLLGRGYYLFIIIAIPLNIYLLKVCKKENLKGKTLAATGLAIALVNVLWLVLVSIYGIG